ncbi:MAG TPA: radical SAM protein [Jatrophihabitantaceae bacterium]
MKAPQGLLADVVRFSWVDGPGNRFVVFLQGCNLNCLACHNPQTIPRHTPRARLVEVDEVLDEVRPLAPYLAGMTVSGGEATLQAEFVRAMFTTLRADPDLAGLTRFIDSNGAAPAAAWTSLLPVTDGVMLDLKALDPALHEHLTGSCNAQVLDAIRQVAAAGKLYEVRLLLIPGINDDHPTLTQTVDWLLDLDPQMRIKVIGFRQHGVRAEARHWPEPDAHRLDRYRTQLVDLGVRELEVR